MRVRSLMTLSLLAAAAAVGLTGQAFGQSYQILGSVSFPPSPGLPGTDDNGPNGTGNAVNYTSMTIQSYAAPGVVDVPNGGIQGQGAPYIIGTLGYVIATGAHSSASSTTAFAYSPTLGFRYFGQYSASSSLNYQDNGGTTSYNGISNQPLNFHTSNLAGENAVGQVVGYQSIEAPDSASTLLLGRHAYLYNIPNNSYVSLGLTGSDSTGAIFTTNFNYSNLSSTTSTATYAFSTAVGVDNLGNASGTSTRYYDFGGVAQASNSTAGLGSSSWFYNAKTGQVVQTGLTGPGYNYVKSISGTSSVTGTNLSETDKGVDGGFQIGTATAYPFGTSTSNGSEAWEYNSANSTTTPVSLYQAGATPNVDGFGTSYQGTPFTYSFNATSGSTTVGGVHSTFLSALNASGQVAGTNSYYVGTASSSSRGTDAWLYTPSTQTYKQMGLLSNGFALGGTSSFVSLTAQRSSSVSFLNNAGQTVGTSTQYLSSSPGGNGSTGTTTVAWFAPANGAPYQIGLSDPFHTATSAYGTFVNDSITELTNTGLVGGRATRYTPTTATTNGSDAFVYDSNSGLYYVLDPLYASSSTAFNSTITYLSDTGVAVGTYTVGSGTPQAFEWSAAGGFMDLTSMTSQTDPNITQLSNAFSYDPNTGDIFTLANYVSGSGVIQTPGGGVAVVGPVPEPASLTIVAGLAGVISLRRRRRVVR